MAQKATKLVLLSVFLFASVGCEKKPMKEPETLDPIIADMGKDLKSADMEYKAAEKEIETARAALKVAGFDHKEIKRARKELFRWQNVKLRASQKVKYLKLRIESRRIYARQNYLEAFKAGKPWPSPTLLNEYQTYKRLKAASLRWDDRVPNLSDRIEKMNMPPPEEKAK